MVHTPSDNNETGCPGCGEPAPPHPFDPADRGCEVECDWWCWDCLRRKNATYWRGVARRCWGGALLMGVGHWAVVSHCNETTSVSLWRTTAEAVEALDWIDRLGCGSRCRRSHRIVDLEAVAA